ncbi:MAG TPA: tRNA (adenosine(37)-N6)-threonylcarbamoyltransferase complex dimerization subunit type 1 TsaB [Gemmataceae bacterium]|nr:tRNA (adenosine(37)-N6)-threonylcarbamoyltransferase complex dimerization subunit type 1 TsaB [Gemmataceae bacterium]
MEPRLLILETSGRVGQVAVAQGEVILHTRSLDEARRHARDLAPTVADLLAGAGWQARQLDGVIVSRGPGSYTGLRVGTMSAKTLAYATGCALLGIETFVAIAAQMPLDARAVDVIADAQQDKVYVQSFVSAGPGHAWKAETPLTIKTLSDWLGEKQRDTWVTGPGVHVYGSRLPQHGNVSRPEDWDPRAESLLRLGLARYQANERDDLWTFEPLYLRPSSAEEKWLTRPGP